MKKVKNFSEAPSGARKASKSFNLCLKGARAGGGPSLTLSEPLDRTFRLPYDNSTGTLWIARIRSTDRDSISVRFPFLKNL